MAEIVPDEIARQLARDAAAKAVEVAAKAAVDAATFTADIREARKDIERLDESFAQYKLDDIARWKEFRTERTIQFRWIMTMLVSIVLAVAGMGLTIILSRH